MTDLMNELMNYEAVYRLALATPGLLNIKKGCKLPVRKTLVWEGFLLLPNKSEYSVMVQNYQNYYNHDQEREISKG